MRKLVGDDFPLAFDANNSYSVGGAIRVGRALEDLGYFWFEEPVQHYDVRAMGEVAQRLDITVSAGEQTYTLQALADLIAAGVRMVQPDIVKMGGITGLDAVRRDLPRARRRAGAAPDAADDRPHGEPALSRPPHAPDQARRISPTPPAEWTSAFAQPPKPRDGMLRHLSDLPGLGIELNEEE